MMNVQAVSNKPGAPLKCVHKISQKSRLQTPDYDSVLLGPFQGGRVSAWTVYGESTDSSVFTEE